MFTPTEAPGPVPRRAGVSPFPFPLLTSSVTVVGSQTDRQFSVTCPAARLMSHLGSRGGSGKQSVQALRLILRTQTEGACAWDGDLRCIKKAGQGLPMFRLQLRNEEAKLTEKVV